MPHINATSWDTLILAEIGNDAYKGMDDDTIAATLNAKTIQGASVDTSIGAVLGYLALNGELLQLLAFAKEQPTGDKLHDGALGAAATLAVLIGATQPPPLSTSDPIAFAKMKAMLDVLLAQEQAAPNSTGVTQEVHDGLLALTEGPAMPWWQSIGASSPFNRYDIERARTA